MDYIYKTLESFVASNLSSDLKEIEKGGGAGTPGADPDNYPLKGERSFTMNPDNRYVYSYRRWLKATFPEEVKMKRKKNIVRKKI